MHRAFRRGVAIAPRQPARLIAGRRYRSIPTRALAPATSRSIFTLPFPPNLPNASEEPSIYPQHNGTIPGGQDGGDTATSTNGSGAQRNGRRWRSRKSRDIDPITIPGWFLERNVKLRENTSPKSESPIQVVSEGFHARGVQTSHEGETQQEAASSGQDEGPTDNTASERSREDPNIKPYRIHHSLLDEIKASIAGGLSFARAEGLDTFAAGKTHFKLYCPVDGATYFLERVVEHVAHEVDADVVRLDAQALAEIAGDYVKEGPEATNNALWSLSYDVLQSLPKPPPPPAPQENEEGEEEGDEYAPEDFGDAEGRPPKQQMWGAIPVMSIQGGMGDIGNIVERIRKAAQGAGGSTSAPRGMPMGGPNMPGIVQVQHGPLNEARRWNDYKLDALLQALVEANVAKRSPPENVKDDESSQGTPQDTVEQSTSELSQFADTDANATETETQAAKAQPRDPAPKTIVMIRGYKELSLTEQGRLIIEKLLDIVQKKRKSGQSIVIVGTSASSSLTPEISHGAFADLQSEDQQSLSRPIVVTPYLDKGAIFRDGPKLVREVNVRHIHVMMQRLFKASGLGEGQDLESFIAEISQHTMTAELTSMLDDQYLAFDEVHRITLTALGLQMQRSGDQDSAATRAHAIMTAMQMLEQADDIKTEWARNEQQILKPTPSPSKDKSHTEARIRKLKKQCNHHERSLLKGVVDPENIQTTFSHVHAPAETVESLKNLTMLSLTRPEAFKYGVLATDKITGCLLYGPPGTGKTLLAKAVAKESGATVLEVSGSDVYDMYVGESEKNVRAIFSLAKKLSPCVVFIDEADAIFASRGSGTNRNSHRELINQFLREWDGMTDTNAFIMVATNRPFDLDDAALRRLPRRLLVDLPVEKDREAILKIHLKEESLDPSISLTDLASKTPLYSGSDLKNMCVSAALAAVKEENDTAAKHNAEKEDEDPAFVFPERRTLHTRHFDKAMEEITSSVSEDMSSLGAIRKFDEKYGDRRGKKKKGGYGFTSGGEGVKEDAAKVRS